MCVLDLTAATAGTCNRSPIPAIFIDAHVHVCVYENLEGKGFGHSVIYSEVIII